MPLYTLFDGFFLGVDVDLSLETRAAAVARWMNTSTERVLNMQVVRFLTEESKMIFIGTLQ